MNVAHIPNLSSLSLSDVSGATSSYGSSYDTPYTTFASLKARMPVFASQNRFSTGAHPRERVYSPIDIDDITDQTASESTLGELAQRRRVSDVAVFVRLKSTDDETARSVVEMGESMSRSLLGYHPNGTFDVDVLTAQSDNVLIVDMSEEGVRRYKKVAMTGDRIDCMVVRLLLKRAVVETRMVFLRVVKAREYLVRVNLPNGASLSETVHL